MVYTVPPSEGADKRFEFEVNGETFDVPLMAYLPGSVVEMLAAAAEKGGVHAQAADYAIFGPAGTPVGDAVRTLDAKQISGLLDAYYEASQITAGESSASTDSSGSTERPSATTS